MKKTMTIILGVVAIVSILGIFAFWDRNISPGTNNTKNIPDSLQSNRELLQNDPIDEMFGVVLSEELEEYKKLEFPNNALDTSNWETYRNEEFGFEIRYPKDWQVRESRGLFAFYHSRRHGADNGVYVNALYNGSFTYNPDVYTKININNTYGYFIPQGIPKTEFLKRGAVLKSLKNNFIFALYFFEDPENPSDLNYNDVFEQMLLSFKLIK